MGPCNYNFFWKMCDWHQSRENITPVHDQMLECSKGETSEGGQNKPFQNTPLWHKDYFKL